MMRPLLSYVLVCLCVLSLRGTSWAAASAASSVRYDIGVAYYDHRLWGMERITLINGSATPLGTLELLLYPNLYRMRNPALPGEYYDKIYPVTFNSGNVEILAIEQLHGKPIPFNKRGMTSVEMVLDRPIAPEEQFAFNVRFATTIPEKFGVFGYYDDLITLQGGWHPYLAPRQGAGDVSQSPDAATFNIHLTLPDTLQLMASAPIQWEGRHDGYRVAKMSAHAVPFFSFSIGHHLIHKEAAIPSLPGVSIVYQIAPEDQLYGDQIVRVAIDAITFFHQTVPMVSPLRVQLAEAFLHQDIVGNGANLLYVDRRMFKVFKRMRRFHEAGLTRGLFVLLWTQQRPEEEPWVIEGLAHETMVAFMSQRYKSLSDMEQILRPFGFIPLMDDLLYRKDVPFRGIYFKEPETAPVDENVATWMGQRLSGSLLFSKIRNLVGSNVMNDAIIAYPKQHQPFRQVLFQIPGTGFQARDLDPLIHQWLKAPPRLDFSIEDIRKKSTALGDLTEIDIKKTGDGIEPLDILVGTKDRKERTLRWEGTESHHTVVVSDRVKWVEIDPDKQTGDPDRSNNRRPLKWKVLLDQIGIGHNFNTGATRYRMGGLAEPFYNPQKRVRAVFEYDGGYGGGIEYGRLLGKTNWITAGASYLGASRFSDVSQEAAGVVYVGYQLTYPNILDVPAIPLITKYLKQAIGAFPNIQLALRYDQRVTGDAGDRLFKATLDFRRRFRFSTAHGLDVRWTVGTTMGPLFEGNRFRLGGDYTMRGYNPGQFSGNHLNLVSAEYRFPLAYETGVNLFNLMLTHTLQGAVFVDAGDVTRAPAWFKFGKADVGVGIRLHVDFLGFYDSVMRFDVAVPLNPRDADAGLKYYLTTGQSF